jgi:hypothetical protein
MKPTTRGCNCDCGYPDSGCHGAKKGIPGAKHCGRPGQCT